LHAPDCVAGTKANPLRNRAVLLLGLGQLLLGSECLVALENHFFVSDLVIAKNRAHLASSFSRRQLLDTATRIQPKAAPNPDIASPKGAPLQNSMREGGLHTGILLTLRIESGDDDDFRDS
jgi:hypothetical protein